MKMDIHRFVELTDKVSQVKILSSPEAKEIFAELKDIAGKWSQDLSFVDQIKETNNRTALRLAEDYVKDPQKMQEKTKNINFEL